MVSALLLAIVVVDSAGSNITLDAKARLVSNAYWSPIARSTYNVHNFPEYKEMFDFKPTQPRRVLTGKDLKVFLPPKSVVVGETWKLDDEGLMNLLKQFHPNPTTNLHHMTGAGGGYGCLSALSPQLAEVTFRLHAEFELEPKKIWFTPAQFTGHLIVNRATRSVQSFRLYLPDQSTNYDMNVPTAADIGNVPRMELVGGKPYTRQQHRWSKAISEVKTKKLLAKKFYVFEQIDWAPLKVALAKSQQMVKPLHVVILFGALADESC